MRTPFLCSEPQGRKETIHEKYGSASRNVGLFSPNSRGWGNASGFESDQLV